MAKKPTPAVDPEVPNLDEEDEDGIPFLEELPSFGANKEFAKDRTIFDIVSVEYQTAAQAKEKKSKYGARWLVNAETEDGLIHILSFPINDKRDKDMRKLVKYLENNERLTRCRLTERTDEDTDRTAYYINRLPEPKKA